MTDDFATDETTDERSGETIGGTDSGGPFVDRAFRALADWRRRELVQYFRETGGETASLDELAMFLSAYEPGGTGGSTPTHDELIAELKHNHIPQLAAAGVVDYDERSETVRYEGQATVEKWLEHVRAVDGRRPEDAA